MKGVSAIHPELFQMPAPTNRTATVIHGVVQGQANSARSTFNPNANRVFDLFYRTQSLAPGTQTLSSSVDGEQQGHENLYTKHNLNPINIDLI